MISRFFLVALLSTFLVGCSQKDSSPTQSNLPSGEDTSGTNLPGYKLIWHDEFSGSVIDQSKWDLETGNNNGWGNNELEYYTNRTNNVYAAEGKLFIVALAEEFGGKSYTSARMKTQGKFAFTYGKITARMRLPYGKGVWPAFWMLGKNISSIGWPSCGELDIMEMVGGGTMGDRTVYGTAHWNNNSGHQSSGKNYVLKSGKFCDGFHDFTLNWEPTKLTWLIDDTEYYSMYITAAEFEAFWQDFFVIFNLAIGGNWPGNPDNTTVFPQVMVVDYVRVYQKN